MPLQVHEPPMQRDRGKKGNAITFIPSVPESPSNPILEKGLGGSGAFSKSAGEDAP